MRRLTVLTTGKLGHLRVSALGETFFDVDKHRGLPRGFHEIKGVLSNVFHIVNVPHGYIWDIFF